MAVWCGSPPEFRSGDSVISIVYHPPEIEPGTEATIVSPHFGSLYAVQLPNGELHRWLSGPELQLVNPDPRHHGAYYEGSFARIINTEGHGPHIKNGMIVKIVKTITQVAYYDLMINDKKYHRWLAGFEIVSSNVVSK